MKRVRGAPNLRSQRVLEAVVHEIRAAVARGVSVLHYSVQSDHLHFLVEAADGAMLARQMQQLFSRIAFAVNRVSMRSGRLFRDRHHRHELETPTEVRRALVYVLFNERKHGATSASAVERHLSWLDAGSSAVWFEDWAPRARPPPDVVARLRARIGDPPVRAPRTWLARRGYERAGGPIRFDETPAPVGC